MNHRAMTAVAVGLLSLSAMGASAQEPPRNYDYGTVTQVTNIEVKPGQLRAYMQDLATGWRTAMEEGKRAGAILSYSVEEPLDPRAGEPNLVLVVVFKNLAAYDRPLAEAEKSAVAQYGSLDKAREMAMHRESMRTILGTEIFRQLAFAQ
ncbi:MAG TPA: hypothetical protein VGS12_01210 [Caulobacteraceae bacterium]|nr:hypothetical protein [Caulobacteraceae bacterium]